MKYLAKWQNEKKPFKQIWIEAYKRAWEFQQASAILDKHSTTKTYGSTPYVVCGAFSLEVYLKCLFMIDKGKEPKWEHDLVTLFTELSPDTQTDIQAHFGDLVKGLPGEFPEDLDTILEMIRDAFKDWRYRYDGRGKTAQFVGVEIVIKAVQKTIWAKEPGLENWLRPDYA